MTQKKRRPQNEGRPKKKFTPKILDDPKNEVDQNMKMNTSKLRQTKK